MASQLGSAFGHLNYNSPAPSEERAVRQMLARGDIEVNGSRPWDIQVYDDRFYRRLLAESSLGGGEAYMDGWWDVEALDVFFHKLELVDPYGNFGKLPLLLLSLKSQIVNCQSRLFSPEVAHKHYDLGNDLYEAMLDKHMQYTCGYWKNAMDLDGAQESKLHLICRKLYLEKGIRVLELGGGFGGLAHFMAANYGCEVVSYNISRQQVDYGRRLCAGLPVRFEERDYREAVQEPEPFDRVAAVGLCEHIGYKNYRGFLEVARARLRDEGLFLLHTIGANRSETYTDPWIDKYIFPNGMLPSVAQLGKAMEDLWIVEDWHNFGPDYDPTLMAWWKNFQAAWPSLRANYGDRFYRMWRFYLLACAGRFRARKMQLWQIVLSKGDIPSYAPVR
jgi:cyclopropane-fatty-acyl-phospholipid synthase